MPAARALWERKYHKTPKGLLVRSYSNMRQRVLGQQGPYWVGLEILSRSDFYSWAMNNKEFRRIHRAWVASGYDKRLSPSVNRIDPNQGYTLSNIEWVTHSINSSLARRASYKAIKRIVHDTVNA